MDFNQLMTAIATNGIGAACAGAVLWFAWFRETKTIPKMIESFTSIQTQAQTAYTQAHALAQTSFESRHAQTMTTFSNIIAEERRVCQRWHEEDRAMLEAIVDDLKDQRHYIANLANVMGLKQAVEEAKKKQGQT